MKAISKALLMMGAAAAMMDGTGAPSPDYRPRQSIFNATLSKKEWARRKRRIEMAKRSRKQNRS